MTAQAAPAKPWRPGERLDLLDANNLVHRLFHATPHAVAPADGRTPINAVTAWVRQLRGLRRDHEPEFVLPIFDGSGKGWRHELFADYKADRPPPPVELEGQWDLIWRACEALRLTPVRVPGIEADDLIAAYACAAAVAGFEVVIVSNDKDLMQLISGPDRGPGSIRQLDPFGFKSIGPREVEAKFGVGPERLGDLLALAGDSSDGIPGVPGIGFKTAAKLLTQHGDLENVLKRAEYNRARKVREQLLEHADAARLSRQLVELRTTTPLPTPLSAIRRWSPTVGPVDRFFAELGFPSLRAALEAAASPRSSS